MGLFGGRLRGKVVLPGLVLFCLGGRRRLLLLDLLAVPAQQIPDGILQAVVVETFRFFLQYGLAGELHFIQLSAFVRGLDQDIRFARSLRMPINFHRNSLHIRN